MPGYLGDTMCEHEINRRITKAEVDEKLTALLKAGEYKKAAELMFAWTVSQIDPEEFANKFVEAAREWRKTHPACSKERINGANE